MNSSHDNKLRLHQEAPQLLHCIYEKNWKQVKRSIFFHKSQAAKCTGSCKSKCNANHSILHYACQFRPPLDIVKALFKAHPNAVFEKDCKERYALHIACKHGCRPEVVEYLLEKNPEAASKADTKDRTPLLLAYKSYVFECRMSWKKANSMLKRVGEMFTKAAPLIITKEDNKGMTALEYGLEEEFERSTLLTLQIGVEDYYHDVEKSESNYSTLSDSTISNLSLDFSKDKNSSPVLSKRSVAILNRCKRSQGIIRVR